MTEPVDAPLWLPFAIIGGFVVVFPLFWCAIVWLLSGIGGWSRLAEQYAAGDKSVSGQRHDGITGMIGGVSYRNVLIVHLNEDGFFIEPTVLFRIDHPRLFIPWRDVTARTSRRVLWWDAERLTIGEPPVGTITLPVKILGEQKK